MARKKIVVADPEEIEWETVERALGRLAGWREAVARAPEVVKKAWFKVLSYDEETGAIAALGKLGEGFHESKHTHPSDCGFMILEGKLVDEKGNEIKKGMYVRVPAGVEEGPYDAPEGCVIFVHSNGPLW